MLSAEKPCACGGRGSEFFCSHHWRQQSCFPLRIETSVCVWSMCRCCIPFQEPALTPAKSSRGHQMSARKWNMHLTTMACPEILPGPFELKHLTHIMPVEFERPRQVLRTRQSGPTPPNSACILRLSAWSPRHGVCWRNSAAKRRIYVCPTWRRGLCDAPRECRSWRRVL